MQCVNGINVTWCVNMMSIGWGILFLAAVGLLCVATLLIWEEEGTVAAGLLSAGAIGLIWATFTRAGVTLLAGLTVALFGCWWMHPRPRLWSQVLSRLRRRPAVREHRQLDTRAPPKPRLRRPTVREHGQALIEFALVLPVLLMVLIGLLEFGRLYMEYFNLTYQTNHVAQAAARLGGNVPELDLVLHNNYLPPLRSADVTLQIDTLDPDGGLQCAGSSATCLCEYGDVIRVTTRYPTSVRILGFHQDIGLQASATLFCWRGGAP